MSKQRRPPSRGGSGKYSEFDLETPPKFPGPDPSTYPSLTVGMTVAMMLPTSLPLIEIFRRLTRRRSDHRQLVALLITGYLSIWLAFGVVAHLFDWSLHKAFDRSAWLQSNAWVFGAGPLILAGLFQFTELKYRCLEKCSTPLSFVMQHWRGSGQHLQAFALGVNHGMFCVGCCWALMLLMFAVSMGSVGWMLALACVMAIEKNLPWGRKLSAPLGITLLAWGSLIVITAWAEKRKQVVVCCKRYMERKVYHYDYYVKF